MFYYKKTLFIKTAINESYKILYTRSNIRRISKINIGAINLRFHE